VIPTVHPTVTSIAGVSDAEEDSPRTPIDRAFITNDPQRTELILVRHGQQQFPGQDAAVEDWRDPPLTELGWKQAAAAGAALADEEIVAVYSSRLARAHETGKAIAERHGLEVNVMENLAEVHMFGYLKPHERPLDVMSETELEGARRRFARERKWEIYPYTESSLDFRRRVGNVIEGIIAAHSGQKVVVACHGGVINAFVADFLDVGADMFFRPAHASIHRVLARHERRVVLTLNELSHLRHPEDVLSF
jgi:probable phosphoglycerate mutase